MFGNNTSPTAWKQCFILKSLNIQKDNSQTIYDKKSLTHNLAATKPKCQAIASATVSPERSEVGPRLPASLLTASASNQGQPEKAKYASQTSHKMLTAREPPPASPYWQSEQNFPTSLSALGSPPNVSDGDWLPRQSKLWKNNLCSHLGDLHLFPQF